jgi:hypothetical protein
MVLLPRDVPLHDSGLFHADIVAQDNVDISNFLLKMFHCSPIVKRCDDKVHAVVTSPVFL